MTAENVQHVVVAVIEHDGRYLLCRRPEHKRHGLLWEFPGGKLEPEESHFDAARRELKEELNLELEKLGDLLFSVKDPGSPFVIDFMRAVVRGTPELLEHSELSWVTVSELQSFSLAPTDQRFAEFLGTESSAVDKKGASTKY